MVYCSGLENLAGKAPETAGSQHFCGSEQAPDALFTERSAPRDGAKVGTVTDFIALPDDPARRLVIPLQVEPGGGPLGFHDDDRMIYWGYWDDGALMSVQDTIAGKTIWPPKPPPEPRIGRYDHLQVYFIQAQTGQIKIGIAADPRARLRSLQTGSPVPLSLLAACEGGRPQEAEYHARFAEFRLHGEWFFPAPELCEEIEAVKCR